MTREQVLTISDALVERGQTHTITVGVHDGYMPRERYSVQITPALSFSPTDITGLQRLADHLGYGIAYINGSFVFTGATQ